MTKIAATTTCFPLSSAQEAILAGQTLDVENYRFNASFYFRLNERINPSVLLAVANQLAVELTLQRVKLINEGGQWQQYVGIASEELTNTIQFDSFEKAERWMHGEIMKPISLSGSEPLYQQWLIETSVVSIFFVKYHHIVLDGFGQSLILKRLTALYDRHFQQDFSHQEYHWTSDQVYFDSVVKSEIKANQADALKGIAAVYAKLDQVPTLGLHHSDFARRIRQSRHELGADICNHIEVCSREFSVSKSVLITAAVASYIYRIIGYDDVVLGLPVTARSTGDQLNKPSMQSNELPLFFDFSKWNNAASSGLNIPELISYTKQEISKVLSYQMIRNEALHRYLNRAGLNEKLTKILVNIIPFETDVAFFGNKIPVQQLTTGPVGDLNINFLFKSDHIEVIWDANPENYSQLQLDRHAERFSNHVNKFLLALSHEDELTEIYLDSDHAAINKMKGKKEHWNLAVPLWQLIDEHAKYSPSTLAVECSQYHLTYSELKTQSDFLAQKILESGIAVNASIGLYGERSALMVIGLLAIQKSGHAYVPLDPDLPAARLDNQIEQAHTQLILYWDQMPSSRVSSLNVNLEANPVRTDIRALPQLTLDMPAYIIFTSGSTGRPKGVVVSHGAIANRIYWMQSEYHLRAKDRVLQKTPFTFDVSLWEFFWPLSVGARLVMAAPGAHKDPRLLVDTIKRYGITTLHFVPPMLDLFLDAVASEDMPIKRVFCSGETLKPNTVSETFKCLPNIELHNLYGPTEAAIDVSYWQCSPDDAKRHSIPIGQPVANTQLWVLDSSLRPVVPGIPGELYIAGAQVALGYINQQQLTAERFVDIDGIEGVLYRTGDLVVLTEKDGLEFLGRLDYQVKIRGMRIELQDIESNLLAHHAVKQVLVTVHNSHTLNPSLVAYIVMWDASLLTELRADMAKRLPSYMIPSHWQRLDAMPLTASGKFDRALLPKPAYDLEQGVDGSHTEALLQRIWTKVLHTDMGISTPFFSLGGDSMMAIRVRAEVELCGWTFDLEALFRNPNIRELATLLRPYQPDDVPLRSPFQDIGDEDRAKLAVGLEDAFPMSAMQESMMYQVEVDQVSSVYRVVTTLTVERPLDAEYLTAAVQHILQRHPLLRSSFDLSSYSQPLILVHPSVESPLIYAESLCHLSTPDQQIFIQQWVEEAKFQTFDLSQAPGLIFYVHRLGEQRFQLSVIEHHVVLDGWSDLLMLDELIVHYVALLDDEFIVSLPLNSHYADFVQAEKALLLDEGAREYWKSVTANLDSSPLVRQDSLGNTRHCAYHANIPKKLSDELLKVAQRQQCAIKSLLIAAHLTVLAAITGNSRVATGSVFNGRLDQTDGDKAVGVFFNTLPLSLSLDNLSFTELASAVANFEYQSHQFGRYPYTAMQRDSRHEFSLDSYVNYMDFHRQWGDDSVISHAYGVANTNIPLAVNYLVDPVTQALSLWFDCDIGQLDQAVCERLPDYYVNVLTQICVDPEYAVLATSLITPMERDLIEAWNKTEVAPESFLLVHQKFESIAAKQPERQALCYLDHVFSYGELNALANRIANALIRVGVQVGNTVGVCILKGPELVASMLAIHKIGAAFLPLDPKYPRDRLNYIVSDSGLKTLVTHTTSPNLDVKTNVEIDADMIQRYASDNLSTPLDVASMAYIIYTSGSTGQPKGAMVTHRNLLNFFLGMDTAIGCDASDTLLALTSVSFDISILELFWPLTKGATIVLASENQIYHLAELKAALPDRTFESDQQQNLESRAYSCEHLIREHAVTMLQCTPSFMTAAMSEPTLVAALRPINTLMIGGEAFPVGLATQMMDHLDGHVFNMYGPTETTIWSSVHRLTRASIVHNRIPIGQPIANTQMKVLNAAGLSAPIGVPGELWIGGEGVCSGYWHRLELTQARFQTFDDGKIYYRTGDRVCWQPNGELLFLGRVDRQVKLRGHRIELDEIEGVISRHQDLGRVAVVLQDSAQGALELLAYIEVNTRAVNPEEVHNRVQHWGDLWDSAYRDRQSLPEQNSRAGDFSGWLSSYTGQPIPLSSMEEWLDHGVQKIASYCPKRVVDVGVGMGLYLRRLIRHCDHYIGIDLSSEALACSKAAVESEVGIDQKLSLIQGDALALRQLSDDHVDLVLVNSVIQYFPSDTYLTTVLTEACRVVSEQGTIFLGDIRSFDDLTLFHSDVQFHKATALTTVAEMKFLIQRHLKMEKELCLSPAYFERLPALSPRIATVEMELKRGMTSNELTDFRYDVVLRACKVEAVKLVELFYDKTVLNHDGLSVLVGKVRDTKQDRILVRGIPNHRLDRSKRIADLLNEMAPSATKWDVEKRLWECQYDAALMPDVLTEHFTEQGYAVRLLINASLGLNFFDLELIKNQPLNMENFQSRTDFETGVMESMV